MNSNLVKACEALDIEHPGSHDVGIDGYTLCNIRIDIGKCAGPVARRINGYATAVQAPALMLPTQRLWSARLMVAAPNPGPLSPRAHGDMAGQIEREAWRRGIQVGVANEGHRVACQNIAGDIHRAGVHQKLIAGTGHDWNIPIRWIGGFIIPAADPGQRDRYSEACK